MVQRSSSRLGSVKNFWYLLVFLVLLGIGFWDLISNLETNLVSWTDTPYLIWVMFQNIGHIKTVNLPGFFETNAFYPNKLSLLFSDLLIPQSLIALPLTFFTNNPILVFNLVLLLTLVLNYWSLFSFWKLIFRKANLAFCGAIFFVFGPFLLLQSNHPQMLFYWPFWCALLFWFRGKKVLTGLMLAIQFLASVYLAVFLLTVLGVLVLLDFSKLKNFFIVVFVFLLFDGIFIGGYLRMKKTYNFVRNRAEYEMYAAWPADYVFTTGSTSLVSKVPMIKKWNSYDLHVQGEKGMFAGIVVSTLAFMGLAGIRIKRKLFFAGVMVLGFINSLGTRIYGVPTLYVLVGRYIPLADSIRATARWNFLFYTALVFFAIEGLKKIKSKWIWLAIVIVFLFESLPFFKTETKDYTNGYEEIKNKCLQKKQVLLEVPVTHFEYSGGAVAGIDYLTKIHLSSLYHGCYLYNGYGSYQPDNLFILRGKIEKYFETGDKKSFSDLMKKEGINLVKFNEERGIKMFGQNIVEF